MKSCLYLLCLFATLNAFGQKSSELRCPSFGRTERYYKTEFRHYSELTLGYTFSRMWLNTDRPTGDHFRFASRPTPLLGFTHHRILSDRLDVFTGLELSQTKQGLKFTSGEGGKIEERKYAGSAVVRFPLGVTWNPAPGWSASVAPYLAYTRLWEQHYAGSYSFRGGNNPQSYGHQWNDLESYDRWLAGLSLQAQVKIRNRLYGQLLYRVDFGTSAPTAGEIRISRTDKGEEVYRGHIHPKLMYFGAGLSYRIFERNGDE